MNKIIKLVLCIGLAVCFTGCTTTEQNTENDTQETEQNTIESENEIVSEDSVLVVYFSRTGNTKLLAEYAVDYYDADLYEIIAKNPYTDDDINYRDSNSRSTIEQNDKTVRPEIEGSVDNMEQYDSIILAYPIWWGQAPRIIDTFLESYDFSGKTIVPFCTSASSDIGSSDDDLHSLVSENVNWIQGKRFAAGTDKETLIGWLEQVWP